MVRRSFNTLTEVGHENDMNSNQMLAIVEQKMFFDDRKVSALFLERTKSEATLATLLSWMTGEMKSRMRATAPLRNPYQSPSLGINHLSGGLGTNDDKKTKNFKCWLCKNSSH